MAKRASRPPHYVDWKTLSDTPLTLELSRRGVSDMSDDLACRRIMAALHEAAHFFMAAYDSLSVFDVNILGVLGKSNIAGAWGGVAFDLHNNQLIPVRFHTAGAMHDLLMTGDITRAGMNDWFDTLEYLVGHCVANGISQDASHDLSIEEALNVRMVLEGHWSIIRTVACAFLLHSDASGRVAPNLCETIYRHVTEAIPQHDEFRVYGSDLPYQVNYRLSIKRGEDVQEIIEYRTKVELRKAYFNRIDF